MFHTGEVKESKTQNHYYDDVVRSKFNNVSVVNVSGRNADVDAGSKDVWVYGGAQTLMSASAKIYISSSNAGDTTQNINVECLDGNDKAVNVSGTIGGQAQVELKADGVAQTILRVLKAYSTTDTALTGNVYIAETDTLTGGAPNTATKVHGMIAIGDEHSNQAHYTVPAVKTAYLKQLRRSCQNGTAGASVDFEIFIKDNTNSYPKQVKETCLTQSDGNSSACITYDLPIMIAEKCDTIPVATS